MKSSAVFLNLRYFTRSNHLASDLVLWHAMAALGTFHPANTLWVHRLPNRVQLLRVRAPSEKKVASDCASKLKMFGISTPQHLELKQRDTDRCLDI